jgi:opine dehydrogenase
MGKKITVLGAGNAGFTLAFHLSHLGNEVALFEHPDFKQAIEAVQVTGEIVAVEEEGGFKSVLHGKAKIHLATSDIKEAIEFGEIVVIIVPAFGQLPIFEMALPYLKEEQIFISMPGNFASLQYAKLLKSKGISKKLYFVDTGSIPYACRKLRDNQCFISGMKLMLNCGVYPAEATDKIIEIIQPMFTLKLNKLRNVLEAGFCNMNMIVHPPPTLLNAGWIEVEGGKFSFYRDGCSPAVCKVMDAIDNERMEIAKALQLKTENFMTIDKGWYGDTGKDNTYEHIHFGAFHGFFPSPTSLKNRYIDEDMAYVLVPIAELLGKRYGVKTPAIDAMITIAEILTGKKLLPKRDFDIVVKDNETVEQLHERLNKWLL